MAHQGGRYASRHRGECAARRLVSPYAIFSKELLSKETTYAASVLRSVHPRARTGTLGHELSEETDTKPTHTNSRSTSVREFPVDLASPTSRTSQPLCLRKDPVRDVDAEEKS